MNNDELDAIKARAEAATEGPWAMTTQGGIEAASYRGPGECCDSVGSARNLADWKFIAHAREDIPALLAALAVSVRQVAEMQATIAEIRERQFASSASAVGARGVEALNGDLSLASNHAVALAVRERAAEERGRQAGLAEAAKLVRPNMTVQVTEWASANVPGLASLVSANGALHRAADRIETTAVLRSPQSKTEGAQK